MNNPSQSGSGHPGVPASRRMPIHSASDRIHTAVPASRREGADHRIVIIQPGVIFVGDCNVRIHTLEFLDVVGNRFDTVRPGNKIHHNRLARCFAAGFSLACGPVAAGAAGAASVAGADGWAQPSQRSAEQQCNDDQIQDRINFGFIFLLASLVRILMGKNRIFDFPIFE